MRLPHAPALLAATIATTLLLAGCGGDDASTPTPTPTPAPSQKAGFAMTAYVPVNGVAEIVAATPDGMTLVYTNAGAGQIGLLDITNPASPKALINVDVTRNGVGEPTSVAVSPDGKYAVVAVRLGDNQSNPARGQLQIYDLSNVKNPRWVKDITIGIGPDSVALIGEKTTLRAVVAIEDEETNEEGDATLGGLRPGSVDVVGLEDLYGEKSSGVKTLDLVSALSVTPNINYPFDPQPEFVSINRATGKAAVSLQENNALALLDLSKTDTPKIETLYSTSVSVRSSNADLKADKEIALVSSMQGRREADAVAWVGNDLVATANEGDTDLKTFGDGIYSGGRGFSLFDMKGSVIFDSGAQSEANAVIFGHYPDSRSAKKGIEVEGVLSANFGGANFLFAASERGSFVEVYRLDDSRNPVFKQLLPTGMSPEGLVAVTGRADGKKLLITANEGDGSLNIFQFHADGPTPNARQPQLASTGANLPWSALSGLTTDGSYLYSVPDNAFASSRIFRIDPAQVAQGRMSVDKAIFIRDSEGKTVSLDPEGIAWTGNGFWIASEGKTADTNELVRVSTDGRIQERVSLPADILARFAKASTSTGFEGVTVSPDGRFLYVALQRGFDTSKPYAAILRYDTQTGDWISSDYPLDQHSQDPASYWTGLSDLTLLNDGRLLVLERDKGGGENGAATAEIKRVYSVYPADMVDGGLLTKTLVKDMRKDAGFLQEKAEGMTVFANELWVVNDNDGAGWTHMVNLGRL
ncbi:MAG: esterase-like activity of phytase family protein [Halothiobacillaceae bacterium]|nr:esterase-like activity of phytase family protein [Halothiobacillaceae bacterium]